MIKNKLLLTSALALMLNINNVIAAPDCPSGNCFWNDNLGADGITISNGAQAYVNLNQTITNTGTLTVQAEGKLTVYNGATLTNTGNATFMGGTTETPGDFRLEVGARLQSDNQIIFNDIVGLSDRHIYMKTGSSLNATGGTTLGYNNIISLSGNAIIDGNITLNDGSSINPNSNTLTLHNNLAMNAGSSIIGDIDGTSATINGGTISDGSNATFANTVTFASSGLTKLEGNTILNADSVVINRSSGTLSFAGQVNTTNNIDINGTSTVILFDGANFNPTGNVNHGTSASISVGANANVTISNLISNGRIQMYNGSDLTLNNAVINDDSINVGDDIGGASTLTGTITTMNGGFIFY